MCKVLLLMTQRLPVLLTPCLSVSLHPGGYLCSHMCVCGPRPRAVRSTFHGRQHKVIRWRPSAGAAPRSLSCPHSFSVGLCPVLTSRQGGTVLQQGHINTLTVQLRYRNRKAQYFGKFTDLLSYWCLNINNSFMFKHLGERQPMFYNAIHLKTWFRRDLFNS